MTVVVVDAGTSSVRAAIVDAEGSIRRESQRSTPPLSPSAGLVEFDALALRDAAFSALREVLDDAGPVGAVGITNQRASTVLWDRSTGEPVGPGLGWQDIRTASECANMAETGVHLRPNQSPTKAKWLWDRADESRSRDLCVGTIDSWLIWWLTEGTSHVTDATNAFASGFMTSTGEEWDSRVADATNIPIRALPTIVDSIGYVANATALVGAPAVTALVGDQQGSMFGQGCVAHGDAKATFGTGGSLNLCLDTHQPRPTAGSFPIISRRVGGVTTWGLEAIMLSAGSCLSWLADDLAIIDTPSQADVVAASCTDTGDVWFVPALAGLGSPYWDFAARGTFVGITRGTGRPEIVRAVIEGIAQRGADLLDSVESEPELTNRPIEVLRVDGGMSSGVVFTQALANATGRDIELSSHIEATTVGAAMMAAVGADLTDLQSAVVNRRPRGIVHPNGDQRRERWKQAVSRSR